MTIRSWPLDAVSSNPTYAGRALRQTTVAPFTPMGDTARPLGALSGVRWGTPVSTVSVTSTTWTCKPHVGVIDKESAAEAGPYAYSTDANVTNALTAADGTNARIDIVYVRISDPAESDGSTVPQVEILYLAGTASGAPVAPAVPARSFVLAQINVPKVGGGSPTASWVAPWLSGWGVGFQTLAQLNAWTSAPNAQHACVLSDASALNVGDYVRQGSAWVRTIAPTAALWTGSYYMTSTQTANLSATVSSMPNGVILVWSRYNAAAFDDSFNFTYVPKQQVAAISGSGVTCVLIQGTVTPVAVARKYVYVSDDHIAGNDVNSVAPANGLVLRAVYGY